MYKNKWLYFFVYSFCILPTIGYSSEGPSGKFEISTGGEAAGVIWSGTLTTASYTQAGECGGAIRSTYVSSSIKGYSWGYSSNGQYSGIKLGEDVILFITGSATNNGKTPPKAGGKKLPQLTINWSSTGTMSLSGNSDAVNNTQQSSSNWSNLWTVGSQQYASLSDAKSSMSVTPHLYVGPLAVAKTYTLPQVSLTTSCKVGAPENSLIASPSTFSLVTPLNCTISTPPKIDFGKVNSWDWDGNTSGTPGGKLGDVLKVVEGSFAINCTGDGNARASATLTLDGAKGRYSDDLKVTMDATGEVAPASVRVTIKDLRPPCSSGISWGPVAGKTDANVVKLDDLTPGTSQVPYRFSLCSTGQGFKGGAASASATIKLDWD